MERGGGWFQRTLKGLRKTRTLQLLLLPGLLYFIVFHYIPMYGVTIAFKAYNTRLGILGSPWIGFEQFVHFFTHPYFPRLMRNTFLLSVSLLAIGFPAPILLALILNEVRSPKYRSFVQTVSYLPHFISTVSIVGILSLILSPSTGFVNTILVKAFGMKPVYFLTEPGWFRTLFVASDIWQNLGFSAIIYLAALSQVDVQLYDAATVDGASRLQRIRHISLPSILPTIAILLVLRVGSLFSVSSEKVILLYNPTTYETADVIGSYVYRRGLQFAEFSYGAAVGLFNSVINVALLIAANWFSKRLTEESLW